MFPSRPLFRRLLRPARLLAANAAFGPPPGPADVIGSTGVDGVVLPQSDGRGGYTGNNGEDPSLVGFVLEMTQYNFTAQRTQTWGGTSLITSRFDDARKFIEGACAQALRQEVTQLTSGPRMVRFYSPVYTV